MRWAITAFVAAITVVSVGYGETTRAVYAQSPDQLRAIITSPAEGQQLFGLVNILGSAEHPTAFARYTLEYDDLSDPAVTWLLVQPAVQQQVRDGVLGTWNTNVVPDGFYRLRLRVFLDDGQVGEYIVTNLRVVNRAPTPVPTVPIMEPAAAGQPITPGPSPTSPIVQPPSNNPVSGELSDLAAQPPVATINDAPVTTTTGQSAARLNLTRVRQAFCAGFYLAMGAFVFMAVYIVLRHHTSLARHNVPRRSSGQWPDDSNMP